MKSGPEGGRTTSFTKTYGSERKPTETNGNQRKRTTWHEQLVCGGGVGERGRRLLMLPQPVTPLGRGRRTWGFGGREKRAKRSLWPKAEQLCQTTATSWGEARDDFALS